MAELRLAHTADLDAATLEAARALLDLAFEGHFSDHDWEHSLGGMHAAGVGAKASSSGTRRWFSAGCYTKDGGCERAMSRASACARTGAAGGTPSAMMAELERVVRGAYDLGALSATAPAARLYSGRGWLPWEGPTSALTPDGVVRTEDDDGSVFVLPVSSSLDLSAELTCDWREGDLW